MTDKRIRRDHHLMIEIREIEKKIEKVCEQLSKEFEMEIGWSDARELAGGMSLASLKRIQNST